MEPGPILKLNQKKGPRKHKEQQREEEYINEMEYVCMSYLFLSSSLLYFIFFLNYESLQKGDRTKIKNELQG